MFDMYGFMDKISKNVSIFLLYRTLFLLSPPSTHLNASTIVIIPFIDAVCFPVLRVRFTKCGLGSCWCLWRRCGWGRGRWTCQCLAGKCCLLLRLDQTSLQNCSSHRASSPLFLSVCGHSLCLKWSAGPFLKVCVRSRHGLKCDSVVLAAGSCLRVHHFFGIVVVALIDHFLFWVFPRVPGPRFPSIFNFLPVNTYTFLEVRCQWEDGLLASWAYLSNNWSLFLSCAFTGYQNRPWPPLTPSPASPAPEISECSKISQRSLPSQSLWLLSLCLCSLPESLAAGVWAWTRDMGVVFLLPKPQ